MAHRTSRKSRPTPLKDVQIAAQADESHRYLVLDAHTSNLSSPAYPFERQTISSAPVPHSLHDDHTVWQVRVPASNGSPTCASPCAVSHLLVPLSSTPPLVQVEPSVILSSSASKYYWNDSLDSQNGDPILPVPLHSLRSHRSFTPPISPPVLSPPGTGREYSSKRSGMTFALVPAEVDGKHVFTHIVMNRRSSDFKGNSGPPSIIPSEEDGLPEDMQDILRQLDDLASWVKAASSSKDYISNINTNHLSGGPFPNKGKNRLLSATLPNSECDTRRDLVEFSTGAIPSNLISSGTDCRSEGFIYVPNCDTPEFLVGSSNSPIAYPVRGYSSHPSRYGPTNGVLYHRRLLERRSAPCLPPASLLISPRGKTSFRSLFQRSRGSTTTVFRPSIPSNHVPIEGALRQGKRMRLPWLKI